MTDLQFVLLGLGLLLLDFIAVAARSAFVQLTHARLLALRDSSGVQLYSTSVLLPSGARIRITLNLVLVLTRFFLAALFLYWASRSMGGATVWATAGLAALVGFILFLIETVIERNVSRAPEVWAVRLTPVVRVLLGIFAFLTLLPLGISRDAGVNLDVGTVTTDELKTLVDAGEEEGIFEQGERQMIYSIFQLGNTLAREIMVPRIDMVALDVNTPLSEAVDTMLSSGHSRIPVYEETVDKTLGLLYAKDLLRVWREGDQLSSLRSLLRPAYFVPEAKKVDELLSEMQSQRIHMAIVVDEYGGVAGLVTLEDIVEEVVGEIRDEYDQAEEAPYQVMPNDEYIFLGRVDLDDFNEIMGSSISKEEADTIGGFIYSSLGRIPEVGETVEKDSLQLTVEQVSGRRIRKVRARWLPSGVESEEANDHETAG
ncbi:MAG: HlyC/CorC family transporter [Chloroflexi bacterium]|nr:HlyC/CorC family transporter [Chloroflexota bacterium]